MNWDVEVTHARTGAEAVVRVEAGTRQHAAAVARDAGWQVRDCYPAGRGAYKAVRAFAWVWFGGFGLLAVTILTCGFGGGLATPGDSGVGEGLGGFAFLGALAALGLLVARAMTAALRRDPASDPRRGFEIQPIDPTPKPPPQ